MPGFKENREHVRAPISAVVRFYVISPAEYNSRKASFRDPPPVWLELYGEIVRVLPVSKGKGNACEIALSFIDLRGEEMEKIVYYAFQQQREAIRSIKEKK